MDPGAVVRPQADILRAALRDHPAPTILVDREGIVHAWNRAAEQLLGWSEGECLGGPYAHVLREGDGFDDDRQRVVGGETVVRRAVQRQHRDGSPVLVDVRMQPVRDDHGEVVGLLETLRPVRDVAYLPRAVLDDIFARLPVGVSVSDARDPEFPLVYVNAAFTATTGYAPEEVIGHSCRLLQGPETARDTVALLRSALRERRPVTVELLNYRKDGTTFWNQLALAPVSTEPGQVTHIVGVQVDVTAIRRAAEAQAEADARFRSIVEQVTDGIWMVDAEWRTVFANPALTQLLGYTAEEMLGRSPLDFVPDEHREAVCASMRSRERGSRARSDFPLQAKDGRQLWTISRASPLSGPDGAFTGAITIVTDVTAQREAKAEARRREEALREMAKLESLGVLAGGIAHDFNNLLTGILANAGLVRSEPGLPAAAESGLEYIEEAARRAALLCRQMLAYAGRGRVETRTVDLARFVAESLDLLRVSVDRRHELHTHFPQEPVPVHGDPSQLQQVVMNLVINASEAIGDAPGAVDVTVGVREVAAGEFPRLYPTDALRPGRHAVIAVRDTGVGIAPEMIARVFEPFFTTKRTGRGLGLAAVFGVVRTHGGAIAVASDGPGRGTTFTVVLPLEAAAPVDATPAPASVDAPAALRVLVVDDEDIVRHAASRLLVRVGMAATAVGSGREALAALEAAPDGFDVALIDLTMPDWDGVTTLERLRERRPRFPAVIMSGYGEEEVLARFRSLGDARFLQKPFDRAALLRVLQEVPRS
jgi:PAS domain S-box-containing protein